MAPILVKINCTGKWKKKHIEYLPRQIHSQKLKTKGNSKVLNIASDYMCGNNWNSLKNLTVKKISLPTYNILKHRHKKYINCAMGETGAHQRKKMVLHLEYSENSKKYRLVSIVSTHRNQVQIICSQIFKHITNQYRVQEQQNSWNKIQK